MDSYTLCVCSSSFPYFSYDISLQFSTAQPDHPCHADFIVLRKWRATRRYRHRVYKTRRELVSSLLCVDSSMNPRWGEDRRRPYKKEENSRRVG